MSGFLGNGPNGVGRFARFQFTAAAGQTVFGGADQNGLTLKYVPGQVEVIGNGLWLPPSDYTATDGSTITFSAGFAAGDTVYVFAPTSFGVADSVSYQNAQTLTAAQRAQARANIHAMAAPAGHINGLTLANNATDAVNDIDIAVGEAASVSTIPLLMTLGSSLTKQLDVAWAVGTNQGGLDTGTVTNNTYHVFLIKRTDTGVVDALFSLSPSAPTMPANYDQKRRIGSILRQGGAIRAFTQFGDVFKWATAGLDFSSTAVFADALLPLTVPTGINVIPLLDGSLQMNAAGSGIMLAGDGNNSAANYSIARAGNASEWSIIHSQNFVTNTSGQIRFALTNASGSLSAANLKTHGFIDTRGR